MWKKVVIASVMLVVLLASALPALAADTDAALGYLKSQQNTDGGFGSGFSPDSTVGSTADVVLAIVATGGDPAGFDQAGRTPLTYLAANVSTAATGGDLAKVIQAAIAAGENPRQFGGVDLVANLEGMANESGKIGGDFDTLVGHTLAVLALASAERPVSTLSVEYIKAGQQENGSWAWDGSAETDGDTNTTAFAVQALIAAGETVGADAVRKALDYYKGIQNEDGGWPYQSPSAYGTDTDANSTAVVMQALLAAGENPAGAGWTTAEGHTPQAALEGLQNESGAFAWQAAVPDDNLLATVQALPALAGMPFPLATMDVGDLTVMPVAMPETGGIAPNLVALLLLGGSTLIGGGYALRLRSGQALRRRS